MKKQHEILSKEEKEILISERNGEIAGTVIVVLAMVGLWYGTFGFPHKQLPKGCTDSFPEKNARLVRSDGSYIGQLIINSEDPLQYKLLKNGDSIKIYSVTEDGDLKKIGFYDKDHGIFPDILIEKGTITSINCRQSVGKYVYSDGNN